MPTVETSAESSKAGITTNADGTRYIPASLRPDGSTRKEIKVRPGYRPPEDVEVYKNRTTEAWKNRGKGGVPGAEALEDDKNKENGSASKNAKRREARKRAAAEKENMKPDDAINGTVGGAKGGAEAEKGVDPEVEKQKEAKKLAKKLRQARELRDKNDNGVGLLPEQFQKVIQINELIRQLNSLGFDTDGERKVENKDIKQVDGEGKKEEAAP